MLTTPSNRKHREREHQEVESIDISLRQTETLPIVAEPGQNRLIFCEPHEIREVMTLVPFRLILCKIIPLKKRRDSCDRSHWSADGSSDSILTGNPDKEAESGTDFEESPDVELTMFS